MNALQPRTCEGVAAVGVVAEAKDSKAHYAHKLIYVLCAASTGSTQ